MASSPRAHAGVKDEKLIRSVYHEESPKPLSAKTSNNNNNVFKTVEEGKSVPYTAKVYEIPAQFESPKIRVGTAGGKKHQRANTAPAQRSDTHNFHATTITVLRGDAVTLQENTTRSSRLQGQASFHGTAGYFSASNHLKSVPLPALYSPYTTRGIRQKIVQNERWVPVKSNAGSPLHLIAEDEKLTELRTRFDDTHSGANLSKASMAKLPRMPSTHYLLVGRPLTMQPKKELSQEELLQLARLKLAPAPELYHGRGFGNEDKPVRLRALRTVVPRVSSFQGSEQSNVIQNTNNNIDEQDEDSRSNSTNNATLTLPPSPLREEVIASSNTSSLPTAHETRTAEFSPKQSHVSPKGWKDTVLEEQVAENDLEESTTSLPSVQVKDTVPTIEITEFSNEIGPKTPRKVLPKFQSTKSYRNRGGSPSGDRLDQQKVPILRIVRSNTTIMESPGLGDNSLSPLTPKDSLTDFSTSSHHMKELKQGWGEQQLKALSEKFDEIDTGKLGVLTFEVLKLALPPDTTDEDVIELMKLFDLEGTGGGIRKKDFIAVIMLNDKLLGRRPKRMHNVSLELNIAQLKEDIAKYRSLFQLVDSESIGVIDMEGLKLLLVSALGFDIGGDREMAQIVMETVDKDGNGTIDFIEFLAYVPFFMKLHASVLDNPLVKDGKSAPSSLRTSLAQFPSSE